MPSSRGRGRGRGRGGFESPSTRDGGWSGAGARKSSASSDWDVEGWKPHSKTFNDPPPASPASSSHDPEASTSKAGGWGSRSGSGSKAAESGWGSGWGASSSAAAKTTTTSTGEWGSGAGWGSGEGWTTTSTGAWGSVDASSTAAKTTTATAETAAATTTTTTTASTGEWGSGAGWGTTDTVAATGTWGSGSGWGDTATTSKDDAPAPITPIRTMRPTDLQLDIHEMPVDTQIPPQSASSSYRAASMGPSILATPQSAFPPFSAVPRSVLPQNMTRSQIHAGIIKNSIRVTRIRLELKDLQGQLATWKKTQLSQQFHRVSIQSGDRLDQICNDLAAQIVAVEKRLEHAEKELVAYPELPSLAPQPVDVDKEVMAYTGELTAWLQSFAALAASEAKRAGPVPPSDASPMDIDPEEPKPVSLLGEVVELIAALEEKLDDAELLVQEPDIVSPERNAAFIDKVIAAARSQLNGGQGGGGDGAVGNDASDLETSASDAKKRLKLLIEQVAMLAEKNRLENKRLEAIEYRRTQHRNLKIAMEAQLEKFEIWKQERGTKLALMREQLARFAAQPPPTALVIDDEVLARVRATVENMIQTEVVPALEGLGKQYSGAIECRVTKLQEYVQPTVDTTNEICQRARMDA
ncbi:hypothetical protein B0H11DRAFT_2242666 [Mycena galericulata]|nr:hypothetical protein B0H11DRAFT_2242666 [Mycena galericulata]